MILQVVAQGIYKPAISCEDPQLVKPRPESSLQSTRRPGNHIHASNQYLETTCTWHSNHNEIAYEI